VQGIRDILKGGQHRGVILGGRLIQRNSCDAMDSYLILLSAETAYQQALLGRVQAQATRYRDTVALFQALGGGWWNRPSGTSVARRVP